MHRTDFHPGTVHHGGGGGGGGGGYGGGGGHHGYGKNIVPGEGVETLSTKLDIEKLVPKDDLSNGKQPLDFVSDASLTPSQNTPGVLLEVDESKATRAVAPLVAARYNLNNTGNRMLDLNTANLVRNNERTVNALTRTLLRPVNFKGSILDKFKKHWDEEEDGKCVWMMRNNKELFE